MNNSKKILDIIVIGFATFAMYFGAGNIAFPINIGCTSGYNNIYAMLGMIFTAVFVPFLGLISMLIIEGDYKKFFGLLGKIPGFFVAILIMGLIGPFGATPRCIALSYTTFNLYMTDLSSIEFGIIGSCIIFILSFKKNYIMNILGKVLTPLLLISLTVIIFMGLKATYSMPYGDSQYNNIYTAFSVGIHEGYNTMDLFASFFFSIIIFPSIRKHINKSDPKTIFKFSILAIFISMFLLTSIYYSMSFISAHNLPALREVELSKQLGIIATQFLGNTSSVFANLIVSLACLTTAITLVVIFSEFIRTEIFMKKIPYWPILLITIIISFLMGQLGFTGIVRKLKPILFILYPMLITLSIGNILKVFFNFRFAGIMAYFAFFISIIFNYI